MLHPQVSGRPMHRHILRDFPRPLRDKGDVWIGTGAEIAERFGSGEARASAAG